MFTIVLRTVIALVLLASLATGGLLLAEDPPSQTVTAKHRIEGLFMPVRELDLREAVKQLPGITLVSVDFDRAEAVFAYDADKLFNKPNAQQTIERFDSALRAVSNSTFGIKPLASAPADQLQRVEIPIAGLDCKGCCFAAYKAVCDINGVEQATASFREGKLLALIDPEKTSREALVAMLKQRNIPMPTP